MGRAPLWMRQSSLWEERLFERTLKQTGDIFREGVSAQVADYYDLARDLFKDQKY
jgi:hypothetical protein